MDFVKKHKTEIVIFLLALFLRFLVFYIASCQNGFAFNDFKADGYYELANNLVNHRIFSLDLSGVLRPGSFRTPGLPLIIAPFLFFSKSLFGFLLLQIVVASLLPLLSRKIALEAGLSVRQADIVGFFMVFEPLGLYLSFFALSEIFFTFFFLLSLLGLIVFLKSAKIAGAPLPEKRYYRLVLLSGLCLGLATLIKPTTIYLPFGLILLWIAYRFASRQKYLWKLLAIFFISSTLILSPWFYRNYKVSGVFGFSSAKAWVMYWALAPSVLTYEKHISFTQAQQIFFASTGIVNGLPDFNLENAAWLQKEAAQVIFARPFYLLESMLVSVYAFFTHDGAASLMNVIGVKTDFSSFAHGLSFFKQPVTGILSSVIKMLSSSLILVLGARIFWVLAALSFFASAAYQLIRRKLAMVTGLLLLLILYFAATTMLNGLGVNARFRFPINSLIIIFIIAGYNNFKAPRQAGVVNRIYDRK